MNMYVNLIKQHEQLFSGVSLKLGEIHLMLFQASEELDSRCYREQAGKTIRTELGNEVGKDEIHWWVFKKETNLDELYKKTEIACAAAQKLKEDSAKMISD